MLSKGKVYLVGAGPGDPELITLKGLRCLEEADVVIYDRLIEPRLLSRAKEGAELIYVGKREGEHPWRQGEIDSLLVAKAKQGKIVARLKGGDPFVLGRGGEEAENLAHQGVPFEIVPGVSAAIAAPAYAGIPVTHRQLASSFAVITGHKAFPEKQIAWDKTGGIDTLVFLMGMENLATLLHELLHSGLPPDTPIALIHWGTTPRQQTLGGTLTDIVSKAEGQKFSPPTVAIVGEVVKLREKLCWFDNKPLFGKRVVVTRAKRQSSHLRELLSRQGAEPLELPTIKIETTDLAPLNDSLSRLAEFDWIIFTSTNGVDIFFSELHQQELDARRLAGIKVCALGKATAQALSGYGIKADLIPQDWSSSGILNSFTKLRIEGTHILLPQAEEASLSLCHGLAEMGAKVERVAIYRTTIPEDSAGAKKQITAGKVDVITFTSPSTVRGLVALVEGDVAILNQATIACIGPVTKAEAEDKGLRVDVVAREHSAEGLVEALVDKFGEN